MEFKGTKGEWTSVFVPATKYMTESYEVQYGKDGECVAEFVHNEYDSKLISAAPDMFYALQELIELKQMKFNDGEYPSEEYLKRKPLAWEKAKQAIEKALK